MVSPKRIKVGLMGLGVVGSGVAATLLEDYGVLLQKAGGGIELTKVLVSNTRKRRTSIVSQNMITDNPLDILEDPSIDVVVEVIGGEEPAYSYISKAIHERKHVVTANKEVMAKHGPELIEKAEANRVNLLFEASVGGGIPIIGPLRNDLLANSVHSLHCIINGTTNYILTRMARDNKTFKEALIEAQDKGYAESDPSSDVEGTDAVYKLAILASLAFQAKVHPKQIFCEGITNLESQDFNYAHELGYAIKLLAVAKRIKDRISVRVHPALIPGALMLAKVDDVYNAIQIEGHLVEKVVFHGLGAGSQPTTSAILGNVLEIARKHYSGMDPVKAVNIQECPGIIPISELVSRYYIRITVSDRAGVLAQITQIFGDHDISIASVIQKDVDPETQTAELVVTTHPAKEASIQKAMALIGELVVIKRIGTLIRIEDWLSG